MIWILLTISQILLSLQEHKNFLERSCVTDFNFLTLMFFFFFFNVIPGNFKGESSAQSDVRKSQSETSDGPSPCKRPRKHRKRVRHRHTTGNAEDSSDG